MRNSPFCFEGIDFVEISTPFGPVDSFDVFLAPGDRDFIDLIPDVYDVELFWSDGSSDLFFAVDVFDFETTVLTGEN